MWMEALVVCNLTSLFVCHSLDWVMWPWGFPPARGAWLLSFLACLLGLSLNYVGIKLFVFLLGLLLTEVRRGGPSACDRQTFRVDVEPPHVKWLHRVYEGSLPPCPLVRLNGPYVYPEEPFVGGQSVCFWAFVCMRGCRLLVCLWLHDCTSPVHAIALAHPWSKCPAQHWQIADQALQRYKEPFPSPFFL